jgi:hypothetical protein
VLKIRDDTGTHDDSSTGTNGKQPISDWTSIFEAPDFSTLTRPAQTHKAKEYSDKVRSALKSGLVGAINIGDFPDAAAILTYGPGFADAAGQLANSSEYAAKGIDILTAPNNPYVTFVMTTIPLIGQLIRNHEQVLQDIPNARRNAKLRRRAMADARKTEKPRFTVRAFGKAWPIYFRTPKVGKVLGAFKAQTRDPETLTLNVFTDPKVIRALQKQGIVLVRHDGQPPST